jgi:hypothetical protein
LANSLGTAVKPQQKGFLDKLNDLFGGYPNLKNSGAVQKVMDGPFTFLKNRDSMGA